MSIIPWADEIAGEVDMRCSCNFHHGLSEIRVRFRGWNDRAIPSSCGVHAHYWEDRRPADMGHMLVRVGTTAGRRCSLGTTWLLPSTIDGMATPGLIAYKTDKIALGISFSRASGRRRVSRLLLRIG